MTPSSRTLAYIREEGYIVDSVERYNQFTKHRSDLFGIIDYIAINGKELIGIQSCGVAFSEHKKKMLKSSLSELWLKSGNKLLLIGWRKLKKGGKLLYEPRIKWFSLEDFTNV